MLNRKQNLTEQIHGYLLQEIVQGHMPANSTISENEIATKFGVSRTPIREVLLLLEKQGLVRIYPQVGSFVAPIRLADVIEAQFLREHLECALMHEAIARVIEADRQRLRVVLRKQKAALEENDAEAFYDLDEEMHALFAEIAGKPGLWELIRQRKVHLDRVRRISLQTPSRMADVYAQHLRICAGLLEGQQEQAIAELRSHLRGVLQTVERLGLSEADTEPAVPSRKRRTRAEIAASRAVS